MGNYYLHMKLLFTGTLSPGPQVTVFRDGRRVVTAVRHSHDARPPRARTEALPDARHQCRHLSQEYT